MSKCSLAVIVDQIHKVNLVGPDPEPPSNLENQTEGKLEAFVFF